MMTTISAGTVRRSSRAARVAGLISGAAEAVSIWYARGRERRKLAGLNDRMLSDIGISRVDVEREYGKPFWRT